MHNINAALMNTLYIASFKTALMYNFDIMEKFYNI